MDPPVRFPKEVLMTTVLWVLGGTLLGASVGTAFAFGTIVVLWAMYECAGLIANWALRRGRGDA